MPDVTDYAAHWRDVYREAYAAGKAHWRPELATPPAFVDFLASALAPRPPARVFEAGCGDGLNAAFLSRAGYTVTAADISEDAIARARETASRLAVAAEFLCLDLARESVPGDSFNLWVDIKTLHCLWEDRDRRAYLASAADALREDGVLFLNCALALADVRDHFPDVFASLDATTRASAGTLDRDLPRQDRRGIRCETLDWYACELRQSGLTILNARREASLSRGWGAILVARREPPLALDYPAIARNALAWAGARVGSPDYRFRCLGFAEDAYERSNGIELFGGDTAADSARLYDAASNAATPPPPGAFVFYDYVVEYRGRRRNWGHVGLMTDSGDVIHAWDVVRRDSLHGVEALPGLGGAHPRYIGWTPVERVLRGSVKRRWDDDPAAGGSV